MAPENGSQRLSKGDAEQDPLNETPPEQGFRVARPEGLEPPTF